ncbi:FBP domain-containing protein [Streptosporangium subroseum]|uniref:FBP domain-containing protein n=1 Tax=Streptosporangium subroseum TaxID=106412 RepID=UPI003084C6F5|nr:FBP domain-containing protein [Streptosporangium subroseum]
MHLPNTIRQISTPFRKLPIEQEIRAAFANRTKGEAKRLSVPRDLADRPWDYLDYLDYLGRRDSPALLVRGDALTPRSGGGSLCHGVLAERHSWPTCTAGQPSHHRPISSSLRIQRCVLSPWPCRLPLWPWCSSPLCRRRPPLFRRSSS